MSEWTLPPLPNPPISKAGEWAYDGHVVSFDDAQNHARAYAMEAVLAERARLLPLLAHTVEEADGWHDDARGGPIRGDPLMDAARAELKRRMA